MRHGGPAYRVLLVGDELEALARPLFETQELVPSGGSCRFEDALEAVEAQRPDALVIDLSRPEALVAVEGVMGARPTPILALHPGVLATSEALRALSLGALDVTERPEAPTREFWDKMARQLVLLAQVRVVRHVKGNLRRRRSESNRLQEPPFPLVVFASSLGGPRALATVLRMIPKAFAAPVCICQHISDGFTEGLAHWLASETALRVMEARDGEGMAPGTVYIAPSGAHLLVRSDATLHLDPGPPHLGFRPSCDLLLASAAAAFGRRAIGVVLTGMGRDGAQGLKAIREHGGRTIAQDEASCVVYGMPREAVEMKAADFVLPLDRIAGRLLEWVDLC